MESGSVERLAKNESFFRQVNERIKDVADGFEGAQTYEFLCECSNASCTERIELASEEYEWVRASPTRFVLAQGHAAPQIEQLVQREDDHVVVAKRGLAARIAAKLYPRPVEG
jgi:hypothetical protein